MCKLDAGRVLVCASPQPLARGCGVFGFENMTVDSGRDLNCLARDWTLDAATNCVDVVQPARRRVGLPVGGHTNTQRRKAPNLCGTTRCLRLRINSATSLQLAFPCALGSQ